MRRCRSAQASWRSWPGRPLFRSAQRPASVQGHLGPRLGATARGGVGSGASKRAQDGDMCVAPRRALQAATEAARAVCAARARRPGQLEHQGTSHCVPDDQEREGRRGAAPGRSGKRRGAARPAGQIENGMVRVCDRGPKKFCQGPQMFLPAAQNQNQKWPPCDRPLKVSGSWGDFRGRTRGLAWPSGSQ